jgi:SHS2 domain-containing protein
MPYRYLEDISMADVAFEATGGELGELFCTAWEATLAVMEELVDAVRPREKRTISLEEPADGGVERDRALIFLLHGFLEKLLYYKDAEGLLLRCREAQVTVDDDGGLRASAVVEGEQVDARRHGAGTDVKAITMHRLEVARTPEGWRAVVVVDV